MLMVGLIGGRAENWGFVFVDFGDGVDAFGPGQIEVIGIGEGKIFVKGEDEADAAEVDFWFGIGLDDAHEGIADGGDFGVLKDGFLR